MRDEAAIQMLSALAQEHRIKIFRVLVRAGPRGLASSEIAEGVGIGPTSASFHLKELDRARLLTSWREGRSVRYAVSAQGVRSLLGYLTADCCAGQPELCDGIGKQTEEFCCVDGGGDDNR